VHEAGHQVDEDEDMVAADWLKAVGVGDLVQ